MIAIIVAYDRWRHIGQDGTIPWQGQQSADMEHFKQLTMDHAVVMGRKTWDSLPARFKPLRRRLNIVVSRQAAGPPEADLIWAPTPEEAIKIASDGTAPGQEFFVIGGGEIYRQTLPLTDRVYVTLIDAYLAGDVTFPVLTEAEWDVSKREEHPADDSNRYPYTFLTYERRSAA